MISEEGRDILNQFGNHIRKLRVAKNLSYRQMSLLCNVDSSNIKKIEKGLINPTVLTIHELAKGLDVPPERLLQHAGHSKES